MASVQLNSAAAYPLDIVILTRAACLQATVGDIERLAPGVAALVLKKLLRYVRRSAGLIFKTEERHRRGLICFE
jgi:hypothetical protein